MVDSFCIINGLVDRELRVLQVVDRTRLIEEHLSITKLPVAEEKHGYRSHGKYLKCLLIESIVKHWWLLVEISKLQPFRDIEVKYSECTYRK